jgi:Leucine-rich repeat (LRR) protein
LPAKIFKNTSKLSLLNLRDNNLAQLQDGDFAYLNNLTDLDLGQNLLATLTRAFRGLNRLKKLNLTRNYIDHIANDAFRGLHSIQEIDLSRNRLTRLRAGMFHSIKGNLTLLDLSGNKIESVDKLALDGLRAIQLNLTGKSKFVEFKMCTVIQVDG